jgi:predicted deacylase
MQNPIQVGGVTVGPGQRETISIRVARLYTHSELSLPVHVVHGRRQGPRLFVSAAIHGDEICGVEIIRQLLERKSLRQLRGTLLAVPVVNVYGFLNHSRYLPDRRDLNRSFPGSETGSLTSRVARIFMNEVVGKCTHGIDLHTGSNHRVNLPQIRAQMDDPETARLAQAFGAPVILDANLRDGSLRQAGVERSMPILLYEAGEALRYDTDVTRIGLRGITAVMRAIGMLPQSARPKAPTKSVVAESSTWVRAPISGVLHGAVPAGTNVEKGSLLGTISDPFGQEESPVTSPVRGIVVGRLKLPLVYQGDALFHVACLDDGVHSGVVLQQELRPGDWTEPS